MTCVVLLELGRLALKSGDYAAAAKCFEEATYAAVNSYSSYPWFPDYGVLEEAFRYGTITHLMANRKGLYPLLEPAVQWARGKAPRQLRTSLFLCAAENYAVLGETRKAAALLDEARFTVGKRKMGAGRIGARLNYLTALVAYQQKQISEGDESLAAAMDYMRRGSLWLFQIGLADRSVCQRRRSRRGRPWICSPRCSAIRCRPIGPSIRWSRWPRLPRRSRWQWITGSRRPRSGKASERCKPPSTSPSARGAGGSSIRWSSAAGSNRCGGFSKATTARLPQRATLQRQDMLARYPEYDRLSRKSQSIREALGRLPLVAEDQAAVKEQMRQLAELAAVGTQQEAILREIALRREPADMVFPPLRSLADVQKSLPKKHAVLAFFATKGRLYGFLLDNERCKAWRVASVPTLLRQMQAMFRDMGQYGQNHEVTVKDISDEKWRQSAKQVLATLLKDSPADFSQTFDELVVVPDGILWYLPFEALQVTVGGQPQSLISRFHIRYAPTLSLCTPQGPARNAPGNTAVVVGKLYPHDADGVAKAAFEQLSGVVGRRGGDSAALAGPFVDLRHALPPPDRAGRSRALRPGSLRLDFGADRQAARPGRRWPIG